MRAQWLVCAESRPVTEDEAGPAAQRQLHALQNYHVTTRVPPRFSSKECHLTQVCMFTGCRRILESPGITCIAVPAGAL